MYICIKRFTLKNQLRLLWRLASPKFAGWVSNLETLEELILQFNSKGHPSASRIPSYLREISICSIKTFNWLDKTHPPYGELFALHKVHKFRCKSKQKNIFTETSRLMSAKYLGIMAQSSCHMKLTITTFLPNYRGTGYYILR